MAMRKMLVLMLLLLAGCGEPSSGWCPDYELRFVNRASGSWRDRTVVWWPKRCPPPSYTTTSFSFTATSTSLYVPDKLLTFIDGDGDDLCSVHSDGGVSGPYPGLCSTYMGDRECHAKCEMAVDGGIVDGGTPDVSAK